MNNRLVINNRLRYVLVVRFSLKGMPKQPGDILQFSKIGHEMAFTPLKKKDR